MARRGVLAVLRRIEGPCTTLSVGCDVSPTSPLPRGQPDDLGRVRIDLLRAQIAFAWSRGKEAPPLLLPAAHRLEPLDVRLAHETHLDAFSAAMFAGRLAQPP